MAIHRFKFSSELNDKIQLFANIHMYDEKFKESFNEWCETPEINELIVSENAYLSRHNYTTDTKNKIYRSIKYYYVKKFTSHNTDKKEIHKETRQNKNKVSNDIMEKIKQHLQIEFNKNPKFKPSKTFKEFIQNDENPLIKKCYKNQYYQIKNKMYNVNNV